MSCKPIAPNLDPDVHGHRGCAGLRPENSIPAFLHALEIGVPTLELDLVMSGDGHLIVSHEPWMNKDFCQDASGKDVVGEPNIYKMALEEVQSYDCGSRPYAKFPDQLKLKVKKPTLRDVVTSIESDPRFKLEEVKWNIEIKYRPEWEGELCPSRQVYLDTFFDEVERLGIMNNAVLQCFDAELLRQANLREQKIDLSYLVYNFRGIKRNIRKLGFKPDYYSPGYKLVKRKTVRYARKNEIKLAVWTVDDPAVMTKMMEMGVEAIITNYPNRLSGVLIQEQTQVP